MASRAMIKWLMAIVVAATAGAAHADGIPASWKRTMTNDPATNYFLAKMVKPLGSKDAELLRIMLVSVVAIRYCKGVALDQATANAVLAAGGYSAIKGKAWSDAQFLARDSLKNFSYRELSHLCAGLDHLFGANGVMAPNLLKISAATPKNEYDPANPYVMIPDLPQPKS